MLDIAWSVVFVVIGYLAGSIPTGYLIAKAYGVNIQKVGSGNIGATNVLRAVGVGPAIVVALMDPLKGFLATLFPQLLGAGPWVVALTGLATVLGNNFNIFLKLKGGKGVATSLGVFLAVNPLVTGLAALLGLFTMALGRYVSLGSLVGLVAAPLMLLASGDPLPAQLFLALALALLTIYRHSDNISRLARGSERRLGEKTARSGAAPAEGEG
ncbi:MAG TPA: glycerol-3-phosphate 1-O-acyltransferase PlsY [Trueperaceae bacterium]